MLVGSTVIFWNSKSIFLLLRQPPEGIQLSSPYLKVWSIGSPAVALYCSTLFILICRFESLKRYMQCQGKMQVPTYVLLFCAPMNAVMNYWFVWRTSLGFIGAPIATVITHWTMALSLMIYAAIYGSKEAWPGWSWRIFEDWKSWKYMLHLAGPESLCCVRKYGLGKSLSLQAASSVSNRWLQTVFYKSVAWKNVLTFRQPRR